MLKLLRNILPFVVVASLPSLGCVQRTLTVRTDPPGALIYMNDQEIGRSPVTRHFIWYGYYDIEVRMPGYESIKTVAPVIAPWWQWVPFDFLAELFPVTDHHELCYTLKPPSDVVQDPKLLVKRGEELRTELRSGRLPTGKSETRKSKSETKSNIKEESINGRKSH